MRGKAAEDRWGSLKISKKKFSEIMGLVGQTAKSAQAGYTNIPEEFRPREMELSFGIKLNAEHGLAFSKVGGEGSFQVTLRWGGE